MWPITGKWGVERCCNTVTLFQWWELWDAYTYRETLHQICCTGLLALVTKTSPFSRKGEIDSTFNSRGLSQIHRRVYNHQNSTLQILNKHSWLLSFPSNVLTGFGLRLVTKKLSRKVNYYCIYHCCYFSSIA